MGIWDGMCGTHALSTKALAQVNLSSGLPTPASHLLFSHTPVLRNPDSPLPLAGSGTRTLALFPAAALFGIDSAACTLAVPVHPDDPRLRSAVNTATDLLFIAAIFRF